MQRMKNMKKILSNRLFFPERRMFNSVETLMKRKWEEQFTAQEIYRQKKIVVKLRSEYQMEDGFKTI